MQTTEQAAKRLPFHESIVNAIREVNSALELALLAKLIKETKIPKGHDEITAAWKTTRWPTWFGHDLGVPAELLVQKQEAEQEEKKKTKEQAATTTS